MLDPRYTMKRGVPFIKLNFILDSVLLHLGPRPKINLLFTIVFFLQDISVMENIAVSLSCCSFL